jgi:hypothetical protein
MSSQDGSFWQSFGQKGEKLNVFTSSVLPADVALASISNMIVEALWWLRRNHTEEASDSCQSSSWGNDGELASATMEVGGLVIEREFEEQGIGRLSVFRPALQNSMPLSRAKISDECLVRVLFDDGTRLQFRSHALPHSEIPQPGATDTFSLLSKQGADLEMSFGMPLGFEQYVRATRGLLRHLAETPAQRQQAADTLRALTKLERRRGVEILWRHGALSTCTSSGASPVGCGSSSTTAVAPRVAAGVGLEITSSLSFPCGSSLLGTAMDHADVNDIHAACRIQEAVRKTRETCAAIEGVMATRSHLTCM